MKAYMSVAEAAQFLSVSQKAIRRWQYERRIDSYKLGRVVRFKVTDLEAFAMQGLTPARES
jgi:excisionase family DNA binding protein